MDKSIRMEKHLIEAWGLWWAQWQKQTKDKMKKHIMSPQAFVNEHLVNEQPLVSPKGESSLSSSTVGLVLPPK
jgi:hypothetical protein